MSQLDPSSGPRLSLMATATLAGAVAAAGPAFAQPDVPCLGDFDASGAVDTADLIEMVVAWGTCGLSCPADLNGDRVVDIDDLITLITRWGPCTLSLPECYDGIDNDGDGLIDFGFTDLSDGDCSTPFDRSEANAGQTTIKFAEMPEFALHPRFTMVYGGVPPGDGGVGLLDRGFTHISPQLLEDDERDLVPPSRRALWWGPSGKFPPEDPFNTQPWPALFSPWNNDLENVFYPHWVETMAEFAALNSDSAGMDIPHVDLLVADLENHEVHDDSILQLKGHPLVPAQYSQLPDSEFILQYKRDMAALTNHAMFYPREALGFTGKISSYLIVPIHRTASLHLHSWPDWTSDFSLVQYMNLDFEAPGRQFYADWGPTPENLDFFVTSGYYFWDYPDDFDSDGADNGSCDWECAGRYLAYNLFQIDVNKAWMPERDLIQWQWPLFHKAGNNPFDSIRRHMSFNSAVFPFFSRMKGLWFWDWIGYELPSQGSHSDRLAAYDAFIYGMFVMSRYNEFFEGAYELYHPMSARDLYVLEQPVWRGVVHWSGSKMLVAAHDPYAPLDGTTEFEIEYYGQPIDTVTTRGLETWIGVCDLMGGGGCVPFVLDNCQFTPNPGQEDADLDSVGDACDNCPFVPNLDQVDTDGDALGDACDGDDDEDGVPDDEDICPLTPNGPLLGTCVVVSAGTACVLDADCGPGGYCSTAQEDLDGDGIGDACDGDLDGDGNPNCADGIDQNQCDCAPFDPEIYHGAAETCDDGIDNNCNGQVDLDDVSCGAFDGDGDGVPDDGDGSGVPGDGPCANGNALGCDDNCPDTWNPAQTDLDGDGLGDLCDGDMDGDGWPNAADCAPMDGSIHPEAAEICFDGVDNDCDGWIDLADLACGATDQDGDSVPDHADNCLITWNPDQADSDGDGVGDVCDWVPDGNGNDSCPGDADGNGVVDEDDLFLVAQHSGQPCVVPCPGDVNGDGQVDVEDTIIVELAFGDCD